MSFFVGYYRGPVEMIELRLLGSFEARGPDGTRLQAPGRRSIALLACLAVETAPWRRADLAELLWPGRSPDQARASLRQELLRLRKAFGPIFETAPPDLGTVAPLDRVQLALDIDRFSRAATEPARALEAMALYRGELLAGLHWPGPDPFTAWLGRWRERMRLTVVQCLRRLLLSDEASEPVARRLIELAPDCEDGYVWLIQHHANTGQKTSALESFHASAAAMRSLGRELSGNMQTLLASLLSGQRRAQTAADAAPGPDVTTWIKHVRSRPDRIAIPDPPSLTVINDRPSLVVLPFADISRDASEPLLSDGLTEEVTNALAHIPGFFVTSRHSAMAYKSVAADIRIVAAELGVRYAIEGSVERYNGRLRVNARLIDGSTGLHLWADRQETAAAEILDVRDEMVQAIVARLQPSLLRSEVALALRRPTDQLDAWGWMQRAIGALLDPQMRREALVRALDLLKHALALDSRYAMAHALLSALYTWRTLSHAFPDPDAERKLAAHHADAALQLEPGNPFVLVHCAETAVYSEARIDDARGMLEAAVARNPNDPHGVAMMGNVRRFAGDDARTSLALINQAIRLSPRDPRSYTWYHYGSWCHWKLGALEAMEAASRRSVDLYPTNPHSWIALTCALGLQGKVAAAREAAQNLKALYPGFDANAFYQMARRFYGQRFPGKVATDYQHLRKVLSDAGA